MLTSPLTGDYRKKKPASVKAADVAVSMTPVGSAVEIAEELDKDDPSYGKVAIIAAGDALGAAIPAMGPVAKSLIKKSDNIKDVWSYPEQLYDSADTSINVSKKPAGYNELKKRGEIKDGDVIVDIGGGRFDNLVEDAAEEGATVKVYDPFNRTPEHNAAVVDSVRDGQADMAMSHNVLNVIQEDKNIIDIAAQAENALKPNGKAHFSVYEGDGKGVGKVTTKGYQRNEKTQAYVPLIEQVFGKGNVTKRGKIITATKSVKGFSEGGMALEDQMEMNFGREVPDNTIGIDPVSGNEIPLGSNAENVRDDIPANLSEGEIVIPADVVNFHGVKLFEDLRAEAKMGYAQMAADGRMGGEPMMEDMDIEITIEDIDVMDDEEPVEMYRGGTSMAQYKGVTKNRNIKSSKPMTAAQHQAKIRGGSYSKRRSKSKPVVNVPTTSGPARPQLTAKPPTSDTVGPSIADQINFGGKGFDNRDNTTAAPEPQMSAADRVRALGGNQGNELSFGQKLVKGARDMFGASENVSNRRTEDEEGLNVRYNEKGFGQRFMEGLGFDEGGLVEPEPFYSQKGGFDLSSVNTVVVEYMNDEGHRIFVTFVDGVPQMEIPEGYYPAGDAVSLDDVVNYTIPTMDGISPEPVQQSSSDRDRPETPAPTPVNYKELSIDELKAMISDQRTMGSKIFAGLSPLTKLIMWDQTRRTKGEIERRLADPATSEVDKIRLNNLLELMNREEPGLVKTLLDKVQGKEFERIASQIPKPVTPDVDYSDPTLAPDQGIEKPYTPDPQESSQMQMTGFEGMGPAPDEFMTTPGVDAPVTPGVPLTRAQIEAAKKASEEAADIAFSRPKETQPAPQTEVQQMRTAQKENTKTKTQKAKERSKAYADVAKAAGTNIAGLGRRLSPSDETKNIDYSDPRRGGAPSTSRRGGGGRNKGGLAKKKTKKSK